MNWKRSRTFRSSNKLKRASVSKSPCDTFILANCAQILREASEYIRHLELQNAQLSLVLKEQSSHATPAKKLPVTSVDMGVIVLDQVVSSDRISNQDTLQDCPLRWQNCQPTYVILPHKEHAVMMILITSMLSDFCGNRPQMDFILSRLSFALFQVYANGTNGGRRS